MLRITLVLFIVGEAVAEIKSNRPCPSLPTVQDFNVGKFMKTWYHTAEYSDSSEADRCAMSEYILGEKGSFRIRTTRASSIGNKPYTDYDTAVPLGGPNKGKFRLSSTGKPWNILTTDYTTSALIWSCKNFPGGSTLSATILTTVRNPSAKVLNDMLRVANANKLLKNKFLTTNQKNCPY